MNKMTLSLNVIAAIIAVTILQACAKTAGTSSHASRAVRKADAESSPKHARSGWEYRHRHDSDDDGGGSLALYARQY